MIYSDTGRGCALMRAWRGIGGLRPMVPRFCHAGHCAAAVARIERDEIEPRMTTLRKLAHGLEVDPAELVGND